MTLNYSTLCRVALWAQTSLNCNPRAAALQSIFIRLQTSYPRPVRHVAQHPGPLPAIGPQVPGRRYALPEAEGMTCSMDDLKIAATVLDPGKRSVAVVKREVALQRR
jgi:hypothetical protein